MEDKRRLNICRGVSSQGNCKVIFQEKNLATHFPELIFEK